jgi:hypothetical protein
VGPWLGWGGALAPPPGGAPAPALARPPPAVAGRAPPHRWPLPSPPPPAAPAASEQQIRQVTERITNSSHGILGPVLADQFGTPGGVVVATPRSLGRGALDPAAAAAPLPAVAAAQAAAAEAPAAAPAAPSTAPAAEAARQGAPAPAAEPRDDAPAAGGARRDQDDASWERAPRCVGEPAAGPDTLKDSLGRLWGWQNGESCAYKGADGQPEAAMDPFVGVAWEHAPPCREPRTEDNVVQDGFGRAWGWQDGNSCRYDD